MPPEEPSSYQIFVDVVIPLATFLGGVLVEYFLKPVRHLARIIWNHDESTSQSQDNRGNNGVPIQMRDNYAPLSVRTQANQDLAKHQQHIIHNVTQLLANRGIKSSFEERYKSAIQYKNSHEARLAASDYYAALIEAKEVLLDRETYRDGVNQDAQKDLEGAIAALDTFVQDSDTDTAKLNTIVDGFEQAYIKLHPHIIYAAN